MALIRYMGDKFNGFDISVANIKLKLYPGSNFIEDPIWNFIKNKFPAKGLLRKNLLLEIKEDRKPAIKSIESKEEVNIEIEEEIVEDKIIEDKESVKTKINKKGKTKVAKNKSNSKNN